MNRYLQDRAMRRMDGRNPYGSKGGYVVNSRRGRGRDRAMGMDNDYNYSEYDSRNYGGRDRGYGNSDYGHYPQQYGEYNRPMEYEMYGIAGVQPMMRNYGMDYARGNQRRDYGMDMNYDYGMDYGMEEEEWHKHLKKWCEKLKEHDRFRMPKEQILQSAKQMGIKFEKYNEEEFLTTYYMIISDYPNELISSAQMAILFAKHFLEDKDSKLKGGEKLCAYYYEVVKGGEED